MTTTVQSVEPLRAALRGRVLDPASPDYDVARRLHNAMIDKRPALIVRCRDAADVRAALGFGRSEGLEVAVRGGGHNGAGLGSVDGGLVIDLSLDEQRPRRPRVTQRRRSTAAPCSATSTTRPAASASPSRPGSSRPPASAA